MLHCVTKFASKRLEDRPNHAVASVVLFYNVANCIFRHVEVLLADCGTRLNTAESLGGFYERVANNRCSIPQLMSEHRILRLKPALRLERRGPHGQNKPDQRDHRANLADSVT